MGYRDRPPFYWLCRLRDKPRSLFTDYGRGHAIWPWTVGQRSPNGPIFITGQSDQDGVAVRSNRNPHRRD